MKKNTIAYLIDPLANTVQRVRVDDYTQIYKWIKADCFDVARINEHGDGVYVDDEGLLRQREPNDFILAPGYPEPLAGRGLCLGVDDEGESVEPHDAWDDFKIRAKGVTIVHIPIVGMAIVPRDLTVIEDIGELP